MKNQMFVFLIILTVISLRVTAQQEPQCACNSPVTIMNLAGKNILFNELSVNILYDNSILFRDEVSGKFYKVKSGAVKGPLQEDDPEIINYMNPENLNPLYLTYRDFISKTGDKYLIKFNGTSYGPYYEISRFFVTKSGDKFMAVVSEKESLGLKLEKLNQKMSAATTDKERQELQEQNVRLVQEDLAAGDDPMKYVKVISNIPGVKYNPESPDLVDTETKFDEIVEYVSDNNGQLTLSTVAGKKLITIKPEYADKGQIFVNSANTRYALYEFGTLTFSDGSSKSELFSPYLTRVNGKILLAYLYYSPGKNAIMQCMIDF